jgi:MoxR-like ATPase
VRDVRDLESYVKTRGLGAAIESKQECVVLIDEIDKAPRDLPNDLLDVIESKRFRIDETERELSTEHPPIVIITSNNERPLPDPFLRRCVFHHIDFPDKELLASIVRTHFPNLSGADADALTQRFLDLRGQPLEKKPATSELLAWTRVFRGTVPADLATRPLRALPYLGALLKTHPDHLTVCPPLPQGP